MSLGALLFLIILAAVCIKIIFFDGKVGGYSSNRSSSRGNDGDNYYCDDDCDH